MEYKLPADAKEPLEICKGRMPRPLQLDPDEYREDLADFGLTKEQENELLQVLWEIMNTFVLMSWGLDTVQMFLSDIFENSGQDSEKLVKQITPKEKGEINDE